MNDIQTGILTLLPPKRKSTPSGWISFNAACCHHRGQSQDRRQRGGVLISSEGGFQYHCFNCNFKTGWQPGNTLNKNTRTLLKWLGMADSEISKLALYALKQLEENSQYSKTTTTALINKTLPDQAQPIQTWIEQGCEDPNFIQVIDYILQRGFTIDEYNWHWSPTNAYKSRLIIPFYHNEQIVGFTGRLTNQGSPKYLTDSQPGLVFNLDQQSWDQKYLIVVEGQLDAIAVNGVAIMHNEPNEQQIARINATGKQIIVVPDRDPAGAKLVSTALENNWSVSLPDWGVDCKDVADARCKYGKLYTLFTILHYVETNEIKIKLLEKKLSKLHE